MTEEEWDWGWTRSTISNLEFAQTFKQVHSDGGTMSEVARLLDRTRQAVSERARNMRENGVDLPYFEGELRPSETVDEINAALADMEG